MTLDVENITGGFFMEDHQESHLAEKEKQPHKGFPANLADKWMAVWIFVVAYMGVEWFWIGSNHVYYGAGVTVYTLLYGLSVIIYVEWSGRRLKPEALFWFVVMALCGGSYGWVYNHSLMMFLALFLRLTSLYFTAVAFDVLLEGKTGRYCAVDAVHCLVTVPFKNLFAQVHIVESTLKRTKFAKFAKEAKWGAAGLLAAIPLFAVVIELLSKADDNFARLLSDGFEFVVIYWLQLRWTLLLAFPVSWYLYGQMYGCGRRDGMAYITKDMVQEKERKWAVVPAVGMYPALIGVVLLYMFFIGLQGSYYVDALRGVLPQGFTYSEYARSGFFELTSISTINLCIILLAQLLCRKDSEGSVAAARFLKYYTAVISVLTLFLIATAMTKMMLYIQAYGLTPLRVISSTFMIFLAVVFLLAALSRFIRIPAVRISVWVFAAGFTVMVLCGMDRQIASYNLARYQQGTLEEIPYDVLINGSYASVSPMYQVWSQTQDMELKEELSQAASEILEGRISWGKKTGFGALNRERMTAIKKLEEMVR